MNSNRPSLHRQRGISAIEMALVMIPIMLVFYIGYDISRYIQLNAALDRHAYSLLTVAANPGRWNGGSHGVSTTQASDFRSASLGLLNLDSADLNRMGLELSYLSETAKTTRSSGSCAGSADALAGKANAAALLGAKMPGEADRHIYAIRLCYRPELVSLFQNLSGLSLLPDEIQSFALLAGR